MLYILLISCRVQLLTKWLNEWMGSPPTDVMMTRVVVDFSVPWSSSRLLVVTHSLMSIRWRWWFQWSSFVRTRHRVFSCNISTDVLTLSNKTFNQNCKQADRGANLMVPSCRQYNPRRRRRGLLWLSGPVRSRPLGRRIQLTAHVPVVDGCSHNVSWPPPLNTYVSAKSVTHAQ